MKRVGIITNTLPVSDNKWYERASAADVMSVTGGNTGNLAFVYSVCKLIKNSKKEIYWSTSPGVVAREVDHIVICCANFLGEHIDLASWERCLAAFTDVPITLIGLGAQSNNQSQYPVIPEGTRQFLKLVDERRSGDAPNIATRGSFTGDILDRLGQNIGYVPVGCPSLHISPRKDLGQYILMRQKAMKSERIAVAAGNPHHQLSSSLEPVLIDIVERWRGEYILQHPLLPFQYAYGEVDQVSEIHQQLMLKVYGRRFDSMSLQDWFRRYACTFVDVPNWMQFLSKFDSVLGPRYHGVALGVQTGVPGCVITIDARTEELCETTGIKSLSLDEVLGLSAEELIVRARWIDTDAVALDFARKQKIRILIDFLVSNGLEPSEHAVLLEKQSE